ncbi:MAG: hypothetical protein COU25_00600 [Candidatus Levybacteria bacterium CG10_big_fil_rev_8_21_14_0_10_35_13]|nr:MAG: hypothetical protein COU25_00600 [Candidatus Levybacteria bacterium CG10_big_fil_rev_8_21_14_0_10_35_13]
MNNFDIYLNNSNWTTEFEKTTVKSTTKTEHKLKFIFREHLLDLDGAIEAVEFLKDRDVQLQLILNGVNSLQKISEYKQIFGNATYDFRKVLPNNHSKLNSGLFLLGAQEYTLLVEQNNKDSTYYIGNKLENILVGLRAGIRTIYLTGDNKLSANPDQSFVYQHENNFLFREMQDIKSNFYLFNIK